MALPVRPLAHGWATGTVHTVDDPLRWESDRDGPEVLALPEVWWPPTVPLSFRVRAVVVVGYAKGAAGSWSIPAVTDVEPDLVHEGEQVEVNGSKGTLTIAGTTEVEVVTSLLERDDGRVLLLQRSDRVGSFQGRWAGVSGFLEDPTPLEQAYREVREETGLDRDALELRATAPPVLARSGDRVYVVHPFRFRVLAGEVRLDWEHVRSEWVDPAEIRRRSTVPKLDRVWAAVAPGASPKA